MMHILLTGGSGGIGTAIQAELESSGNTVAAPTSAELDLSNPQLVTKWLSMSANQEFDGIVLSAGVNIPQSLGDASEEDYSRIFQLNTNSCRQIIKHSLTGMKKKKFGRIVAISSSYSTLSRVGRSSYSISKAALEALIRSVAVENAESNIIANSVIPGFIETPLTRKNNSEEQIKKLLERVPVNRLGTPSEVAKLAAFLMAEENTYITGQSIKIDGGFSIN
jgi:NAD(P)-dependent dehydrogenase (short-subunit alcohol dehydrogenase family)